VRALPGQGKSSSKSQSVSKFFRKADIDFDTDSDVFYKQDAVKACSTAYLVNKYTTSVLGKT
jgi:hypothetical protein